jgi:hypothetical protein
LLKAAPVSIVIYAARLDVFSATSRSNMFPLISIFVCSIEHTIAGLSWLAHPFGFLRLVAIQGDIEHSDLIEYLRIEWAGGTTNFMKFHLIGSDEEEIMRREKQVAQVSTCAVLVVLLA